MFATDFLPNGPYTWTLAILLFGACLLALASSERRELWFVVVVMFGNWVFVQAASDINNIGLAAVGAVSAGVLLVIWGTEVAFAISVLYVPRLFVYALHHFLGLPEFWMWEVSNVFFILQVLLLTGGSIHGTRIYLARLFDFVGSAWSKRIAAHSFWSDFIHAVEPVHKIDRSPFQKS